MARRLDGSTGGESLAGPRLRAFLSIRPVRAREQKAVAAKLRAFARADIGNLAGQNRNCAVSAGVSAHINRVMRIVPAFLPR